MSTSSPGRVENAPEKDRPETEEILRRELGGGLEVFEVANVYTDPWPTCSNLLPRRKKRKIADEQAVQHAQPTYMPKEADTTVEPPLAVATPIVLDEIAQETAKELAVGLHNKIKIAELYKKLDEARSVVPEDSAYINELLEELKTAMELEIELRGSFKNIKEL